MAFSFAQDSAAFLHWFRSSEGTRVSDKIQIADLRAEGAGRAVVATQDIQEDEELFAVPKSLVLQPQTSSLPKHLSRPLPDSDSWLPLIATIIYEQLRGEESSWASYLRLLPSIFDTLMFWSEQELVHLKGSKVVNKIGKAGAEDAWQGTIIPLMLENPKIFPCLSQSKEEKTVELIQLAHRAGSLIMAYAFDIDKEDTDEAADGDSDADSSLVSDNGEESTFKGMVPFADLLNADADRNNAKLFGDDDCLIMKTIAPIKAGEEIFNDYGPLPRSDLLRMYGYITQNYAQYDVVELLQSEIMATAQNIKREVTNDQSIGIRALDELGLLEDGYIIQRPPSDNSSLVGAIPAELHMLLRALTCNLGKDASSNERRITKGIKENITIEEASLLAAVCTKRLTDYPTGVEEDDELLRKLEASPDTADLAGPSVSPHRLKMAIYVRKGEKEILHGVIQKCHTHITRSTSEIQNDATGTKRKHQGEDGRSTEKEKQMKKSKRDGFR